MEYSIFDAVWAATVETEAISNSVVSHNFRIVISLSVWLATLRRLGNVGCPTMGNFLHDFAKKTSGVS
jgi:hypothetical protein